MINKAKWDRLKNFLKVLPEHRFGMESWVFLEQNEVETMDVSVLDANPCGSKACLAGWTHYLEDPTTIMRGSWSFGLAAANILGLDRKTAARLFACYIPAEDYMKDDFRTGRWDSDIEDEYEGSIAGAIAMMERIEQEEACS